MEEDKEEGTVAFTDVGTYGITDTGALSVVDPIKKMSRYIGKIESEATLTLAEATAFLFAGWANPYSAAIANNTDIKKAVEKHKVHRVPALVLDGSIVTPTNAGLSKYLTGKNSVVPPSIFSIVKSGKYKNTAFVKAVSKFASKAPFNILWITPSSSKLTATIKQTPEQEDADMTTVMEEFNNIYNDKNLAKYENYYEKKTISVTEDPTPAQQGQQAQAFAPPPDEPMAVDAGIVDIALGNVDEETILKDILDELQAGLTKLPDVEKIKKKYSIDAYKLARTYNHELMETLRGQDLSMGNFGVSISKLEGRRGKPFKNVPVVKLDTTGKLKLTNVGGNWKKIKQGQGMKFKFDGDLDPIEAAKKDEVYKDWSRKNGGASVYNFISAFPKYYSLIKGNVLDTSIGFYQTVLPVFLTLEELANDDSYDAIELSKKGTLVINLARVPTEQFEMLGKAVLSTRLADKYDDTLKNAKKFGLLARGFSTVSVNDPAIQEEVVKGFNRDVSANKLLPLVSGTDRKALSSQVGALSTASSVAEEISVLLKANKLKAYYNSAFPQAPAPSTAWILANMSQLKATVNDMADSQQKTEMLKILETMGDVTQIYHGNFDEKDYRKYVRLYLTAVCGLPAAGSFVPNQYRTLYEFLSLFVPDQEGIKIMEGETTVKKIADDWAEFLKDLTPNNPVSTPIGIEPFSGAIHVFYSNVKWDVFTTQRKQAIAQSRPKGGAYVASTEEIEEIRKIVKVLGPNSPVWAPTLAAPWKLLMSLFLPVPGFTAGSYVKAWLGTLRPMEVKAIRGVALKLLKKYLPYLDPLGVYIFTQRLVNESSEVYPKLPSGHIAAIKGQDVTKQPNEMFDSILTTRAPTLSQEQKDVRNAFLRIKPTDELEEEVKQDQP